MIVVRTRRLCSSRTSAYASASSCRSRVEPSMSVKTSVTTPVGGLSPRPSTAVDYAVRAKSDSSWARNARRARTRTIRAAVSPIPMSTARSR